ncbi:uncharacterized protein LOC135094316 [Scylla paramamosain]|uniref:uncharacterized protein LOC135094316 n=1 Tax=Scylla paramamosain TaxID=85552 RepID=UPI00308296FE
MHPVEVTVNEGRVKCTVILAFVVTALACTALGYSIGLSHSIQGGSQSRNESEAIGSDNSSSSSARSSQRPSWNDTVQELIGLGCRPVKTKVPLETILDMRDSRWDYIFQRHVAVFRCCDQMAFCGDEFGVVEGTCEATRQVTKVLRLFNDSGGPDVVIEAEEHLECGCKY